MGFKTCYKQNINVKSIMFKVTVKLYSNLMGYVQRFPEFIYTMAMQVT